MPVPPDPATDPATSRAADPGAGPDRRAGGYGIAPRTRVVVTAVAVVAALAVAVVFAPWPARLGAATTGDARLAARVRDLAGDGRVGLAVATVDRGRVTTAGVGDDGHGRPVTATTPFEMGSVTKTFTGALLAALVRQGVVRPDERVRDVAPDRTWRRGGVGDATLAELASHRSGLPVQSADPALVPGRLAATWFGASVTPTTPAQLLAQADAAPIAHRGEHVYSNLGVALLGQLLAERTGTPYPALLRQYVTGPLHLDRTVVPASSPPAGAVQGHDETGRRVGDWISPGDAPAGSGVYTTLADLTAYTQAAMAGTQPVAGAVRPRFSAGGLGRIGYGWYTLRSGGHTLVWKNGASGGCASTVLYEPATRRAVVVLSDTTVQTDDLAFRLLGVPPLGGGDSAGGGSAPGTAAAPAAPAALSVAALLPVLTAVVLGAVFPVLAGLSMLATARGGWRRRTRRTPRRTAVLGAFGTGLVLLAAAYVGSPATYVLAPFWLLGWALFGAGVALAVLRWRRLDAGPGRARVPRWIGAVAVTALGVGLAVGVTGVAA